MVPFLRPQMAAGHIARVASACRTDVWRSLGPWLSGLRRKCRYVKMNGLDRHRFVASGRISLRLSIGNLLPMYENRSFTVLLYFYQFASVPDFLGRFRAKP